MWYGGGCSSPRSAGILLHRCYGIAASVADAPYVHCICFVLLQVIKFKKFAYVSSSHSGGTLRPLGALHGTYGWQLSGNSTIYYIHITCARHYSCSQSHCISNNTRFTPSVHVHECQHGVVLQGACEMLFNPLKYWLARGPFNKLFVNYITNKYIKWYQKVRARPSLHCIERLEYQ